MIDATHLPTAETVIVGGGLAGLSLALRLADADVAVTVLAKTALTEGSSRYAQGGIAAAIGTDDSIAQHVADTLHTGAGLCNPQAVQQVVERGPDCIRWLIDAGVHFTRAGQDCALTLEGGHSRRRIIHAGDATGRAVMETLEHRARTHTHIRLLEYHIAVDLISAHRLGQSGTNRILGLYVLDVRHNRVMTLPTRSVALATGGCAKAWLYTSNPDTSTGDGIAMAWRAGCPVTNLEFIQFHPTCLYHPGAKSLLLSETMRGEGGRLVLPDGKAFMQHYSPMADLAPRDITARAIDQEMKRAGLDCVYLDVRHLSARFVRERFPSLYKRCLSLGVDMTLQPLPVVPAAHYTCGGIIAGLDGSTALDGLYAIGECAATGLHGANRLASNSLLECLVMAATAQQHIRRYLDGAPDRCTALSAWDESRVSDPDEMVVVAHNWDELRRFMWDYVGIVRSTRRLQRAAHRIRLLQEEVCEFYAHFKVSPDLLELRNLLLAADLTVQCAQQRQESRGLHYTLDFPCPGDVARNTLLTPDAHPLNPPIPRHLQAQAT